MKQTEQMDFFAADNLPEPPDRTASSTSQGQANDPSAAPGAPEPALTPAGAGQAAEPAEGAEPDLSFEEAMQKLEVIVAELEQGEAPLRQTLDRFEQGLALARFCAQELQQVEETLRKLTLEDDGQVTSEPFAEEPS